MKKKGRLSMRHVPLMNGFYIEVRNKGSQDRAVKIRSIDKPAMEVAVTQYKRNNKEVTILGEYKDQIWLK
ncbi:MAG: hypothetical protein LH473_01595 [Chitinophagales bacterium]|nr:hypothetical protein [Chitinophagales bacterium]